MRFFLFATVALMVMSLAQAFLPSMPQQSSSTVSSSLHRRQANQAIPTASFPLVTKPLSSPVSSPRGRGLAPLYGIFGLGTPELVVIALVAGIVLGPDKIVDLARGVGKAAGELKAVPQEFEKGLKTGEEAAVKAKQSAGSKGEEKKEDA